VLDSIRLDNVSDHTVILETDHGTGLPTDHGTEAPEWSVLTITHERRTSGVIFRDFDFPVAKAISSNDGSGLSNVP